MTSSSSQKLRCGRCGAVMPGIAGGSTVIGALCADCERIGGSSFKLGLRMVLTENSAAPVAPDPNLSEARTAYVPSPPGGTAGPPPAAVGGAAALGVGSMLGTYRITGELGRGGMGVVYRAADEALGREVAIKVLFNCTNETRGRFAREARLAAGLIHPNIVTVHQVGDHGGLPYIVTELMPGGSLDRVVSREGKLTILAGCKVALAAARALGHAHARNIVHRDVKPPNLLIAGDGTVKIGDFGLAKSLNETSEHGLTATGNLMGTPQYVAPEQCQGDPAAPTSDIYSLGCTLFYLLAGKHPFEAESVFQILAMHMHEQLPDIRRKVPEVPEALADLIRRATAKDPAKRQQNGNQFADELEPIVVDIETGRTRKRAGGRGALVAAAAIVVAAAVAGGILLAWTPERKDGPVANNGNGKTALELKPDHKPEVTKPEVTKPEVTKPEVTKPEVTKPEVTKPEVTKPDVTKPDVTKPDVSKVPVTDPAGETARKVDEALKGARATLAAGKDRLDGERLAAGLAELESAARLAEKDPVATKLITSELQQARALNAAFESRRKHLAEAKAAADGGKTADALKALEEARKLFAADPDVEARIAQTRKKLADEEAAFREAETKLAEMKAKAEADRLKRERLAGLKRDAAAALAARELAKAEKLYKEAAEAGDDPDIRSGVERVGAEKELSSLLGTVGAALKARNAEAFTAALSSSETAQTAATMSWLGGFDKVELVLPPGQAPEVAGVDTDGTVRIGGRIELALTAGFDPAKPSKLTLSLPGPFRLTGAAGKRKFAADGWNRVVPEFVAAERQALQKVLDDLSSLEPARYSKHLGNEKSANDVKAWLEWLSAYKQAVKAKGGEFSIRQEIASAAVYPADGTGNPDTAVVTVKVLVRGEPRKPLRCHFRKGPEGWKLVDQKVAAAPER